MENKELNNNNPKTAVEVLDFCNKKITEYGFNMKLIDAEYTRDNTKILISYASEDYMDLRELVKVLASEFRIKVELRQHRV